VFDVIFLGNLHQIPGAKDVVRNGLLDILLHQGHMFMSSGMEDDLRVITRKNHFQTRSITHIGHQDLKIKATSLFFCTTSIRCRCGGRRLPRCTEFTLSFVEGFRSQ